MPGFERLSLEDCDDQTSAGRRLRTHGATRPAHPAQPISGPERWRPNVHDTSRPRMMPDTSRPVRRSSTGRQGTSVNSRDVADAAIRKDKAFIPDISILWRPDFKPSAYRREFLKQLSDVRALSDDEAEKVEDAIDHLRNLLHYSL